MSYKEDIKINKFKLDNELVKQPVLYLQYQEEMIEAQQIRDNLKIKVDVIKDELKTTEAGLYIKYKKEKDENGKFPTDSTTNNLVLISEDRRKKHEELYKVQKEFNKAVYNFSMLEAAVKSFEQRKKSLEKLVDMYMSGYYSEVKQEKREKQSNNLRGRLNKNG